MKIRFVLLVLVMIVCAGMAGAQEEPAGVDLVLTKTGPETASADTDIVYTVTVTNVGDVGAPSPVMTDMTPSGTTFVSVSDDSPIFDCALVAPDNVVVECTAEGETLAPGSTATFTLTFHIDAQVPDGSVISNTATVTSDPWIVDPGQGVFPSDVNEENNTDFAFTSVGVGSESADVSVTKSAPQYAAAGSEIDYVITVVNGGPGTATAVTLSDTIPAEMTFVGLVQAPDDAASFTCTTPPVGSTGTVECSTASLPAGATATFTLTLQLDGGSPGNEFTNVATVSSDNDPNGENDSAAAGTTILEVDLSVAKTGPAIVDATGTITYQITVANEGPHPSEGVAMSDVLPTGTTFVSLSWVSGVVAASCSTPDPGAGGTVACNWEVLNPGQTSVYQLEITPGAGTQVTNTATVSGSGFDNDPSNNSGQAVTAVNPIADLSVVKTGPESVQAGSTITWTVTITNSGPSTATSVSMYDMLPSEVTAISVIRTSGPAFSCTQPPVGASGGTISCTTASLPPGTASFQIQARVSPTAIGPLTNVVSVTSATTDPDDDDRSASTAAAVTPAPPEPIPTVSTISLIVLAAALALTALFARGPGAA